MTSIYIIVAVAILVLILVAIAFLVLNGKDKNDEVENDNEDFAVSQSSRKSVSKASNVGLVSGDDNDMQSKMQAEESELLTKYTAGGSSGIEEVEELLERDPNNVDLLDWLAFMYYSNGDTDKAIETYKRALAIKPDNENQHYYLGNSYYKKNMFIEAKKCWSEVIRLKPASKIAKNAQERIEYLKSKGK